MLNLLISYMIFLFWKLFQLGLIPLLKSLGNYWKYQNVKKIAPTYVAPNKKRLWPLGFMVQHFVLKYYTFNHIANKSLEGLGYAYLDCNLLNRATLIIITLRVKSSHIEMHEHLLQKGMYVRVKNFGIKLKLKRSFEKGQHVYLHDIKIHDNCVFDSSLWTRIGYDVFPHRFHKGIQNFILDLGFCHPCCHGNHC